MPQSLVKNFVHIVFSTKYRRPLISDSIKDELFTYMGGTCNEFGSKPVIVGGYLDHVHILVNLSRKIALMYLVEKLKTSSSKWIKTKGYEFGGFYWQHGYGAFSVSPRSVSYVERYIRNQEKHHKKTGFKDEFRDHMRKNGIDWDERYVWD